MPSSDFPLPKRRKVIVAEDLSMAESAKKESSSPTGLKDGEAEYTPPKIASNLKSFRARWAMLESRLSPSASAQERRELLHDAFTGDLSLGKIKIQRDTSICGRYSAAVPLPTGSKPPRGLLKRSAPLPELPLFKKTKLVPAINAEPLATLSRDQTKLAKSMIAREGNRGIAPMTIPTISGSAFPPAGSSLASLVAYAAAKATEVAESGMKPHQTISAHALGIADPNKRRRTHRPRAA